MNRLRSTLAVGLLLSTTSAVLAGPPEVAKRARVIRQGVSALQYSAEIPVVVRTLGTAFFRTQVAITNNTTTDFNATLFYCYTCLQAPCNPVGGFKCTLGLPITLQAGRSFVQDDFVDYLNSQGVLEPGANQSSIGTVLVNFDNVPSIQGWEASVVARTYNQTVEGDASQGTVGFAYNASLFFDSADTTLVGFARDTQSTPGTAGTLSTNLGIHNTDIFNTDNPMTVKITCFDTANGAGVGNPITFSDLRPGEVRQVTDLWATAGIPSTVHNVIVFADALNPTATSPTMEGYIAIKENQHTKDIAFFTMLCGDTNGCNN